MMTASIKWAESHDRISSFHRWWNSRSFFQQRLLRFCTSMLVMVICFPLYYLGLFGSIDGPLHPVRLGERLAGMGISRTHSMIFFLTVLIIAVSWNWIFNFISLIMGSRLTCTRLKTGSTPCDATVRRHKIENRNKTVYICVKGHRRADAYFHPVRKGPASHSIWLISLIFCIIVFISY